LKNINCQLHPSVSPAIWFDGLVIEKFTAAVCPFLSYQHFIVLLALFSLDLYPRQLNTLTDKSKGIEYDYLDECKNCTRYGSLIEAYGFWESGSECEGVEDPWLQNPISVWFWRKKADIDEFSVNRFGEIFPPRPGVDLPRRIDEERNGNRACGRKAILGWPGPGPQSPPD
jgi:hypothetical protein